MGVKILRNKEDVKKALKLKNVSQGLVNWLKELTDITNRNETAIDNLGLSTEYTAIVTLTQADILQLSTVGKELVPDSEVAADEIIVITSYVYEWSYGGTVFVSGGNTQIAISNTGRLGTSVNYLSLTLGGVLTLTKDFIGWSTSSQPQQISNEGLLAGLGLVITIGGTDTDPTGGHADTTCKITITYKKVIV